MILAQIYTEQGLHLAVRSDRGVVDVTAALSDTPPSEQHAAIPASLAAVCAGGSAACAASGSEHRFSHLWEMQALAHGHESVPHGFKVGVGTLAAAALYERVLARDLTKLDSDALCRTWSSREEVRREVEQAHSIPNLAAYSASKRAVIALTKALVKEVAREGVYVNCLAPVVIDTAMNKAVTPEMLEYMVSRIPLGRVGQPEEVAELIAWVASDACCFTTGFCFDSSGGRATY